MSSDAMTTPVQDSDTSESIAAELEPSKYWALWQHPEGRYAYVVGTDHAGWLIVLESEALGRWCLLSDARQNHREPSQYRLDELTLPDAFAAARAQSVPFMSSHGVPVQVVLGVFVIGAGRPRYIPL